MIYEGDQYPELEFEYSIDGENWQDETLFEGLEPGTDYTLYARTKETESREASDPVSGLFTTKNPTANLFIVLQNADESWTEPTGEETVITAQIQFEDRPGFSVTGYSLNSYQAEEESRTKSVIMNWSVDRRFSRGIFLTPELLGYDRDENGNLVVRIHETSPFLL